jgi:hypothetical protein
MSDILKDIAAETDKKLLKWLQEGKREYNPITGKKTRRDLTAAEIAVILKRLAQTGVTAAPAGDNTTKEIMERLAQRGSFKFRGLPPQAETA